MPIERWLLFAVTESAAYLVPGPAVFFVVSQTLALGSRAAPWAILGILLAEVIYFVLSATGLGILLLGSHTLFLVIKWAGAAYLVWLGVQALRGHGELFDVRHAPQPFAAARRLVLRGILTNLANPKALLFYVAILPQFIDPTAPTAPQFFLLGATSICAGTAVFALYAAAAERMAARLRSPAFARYTNAGCGVLLIGAGMGLALAEE